MSKSTTQSAYDKGYSTGWNDYKVAFHWEDQIFYFLSGFAMLGLTIVVLLIVG